MDVGIGIAAAVLFVGVIIFIKRKIRYGSSCCGDKEKVVDRVQVSDADPSHYPHHYLIKVEGMITFNLPCVVALAATYQEIHSAKWTAKIALYYTVTALLLAFVAYHVGLLIW